MSRNTCLRGSGNRDARGSPCCRFESPKRAEFFGPRGITATAFRDPDGDNKMCAVLIDTPDLETFQKALAEPEAAEAEAYDGVDPATIQIFVAE